ncbi:MAG: MBL fold metallo-hydrolase [Anaerolineales bacterium]
MLAQREVVRYTTNQGAKIFQIPLNGLEDFWVFVYLIAVDDLLVLIDTGTNFHNSNRDLIAGFATVGEILGRSVGFADLTHIFITHGHIDHIAGLAFIAPQTQAQIGVHEYDYPVVVRYHEHKEIIVRRLESYLIEGGVKPKRIPEIMNLYLITKGLFESARVDFTFGAKQMQVGPFEFFHVPGHSAGAVAIRLHDVVFVGDHVLSEITPHQVPECLNLNAGLSHYLDSLTAVVDWADQPAIVLGGHNAPIIDLRKRVSEILHEHYIRLTKILDIVCDHPITVLEISKTLFGQVAGYNILLALEEAGAHIEYLYRLGFISIENIEEVKTSSEPVTLRYQCLRNKEELESVFPKI